MDQLLWQCFTNIGVSPQIAEYLVNKKDEYLTHVFTDHNFEVNEHIGDGVMANFIGSYFLRRFPNLDTEEGVKTLARLKIVYGSRDVQSKIADSLGFFPHIVAHQDKKQLNTAKLLEDVFEAFLGYTQRLVDDFYSFPGAGFGVCYKFLQHQFDAMHISLAREDLYDAVTRLKEYVETSGLKAEILYPEEDAAAGKITKVVLRIPGKLDRQLARVQGTGAKQARKRIVAQKALDILQDKHTH